MSERTAVVGAGLAGLTVARRLAEAGDEVVVFDKARGPGGRASSRRSDAGGFDHGAQYFTARDPRFASLVSSWVGDGLVAPWEGRFHTLRRGTLGPDPKPGTRWVGVPRMSALSRGLAHGLACELRTRIESVERDERGWRLSDEHGEVHEAFDRVLVATPAPQAVPLLEPRPELADLAASARLEPCQAVLMTFAEPLDAGFDGAFVEDSPLAWVAAQSGRPGRGDAPSFVLHASADWSARHLEDDPVDVAHALLAAFAEALGRPLPATVHLDAHRWRFALASRPLGRGALWEPETGFGACGDWLVGGKIEAAVTSGLALADAILGRDDPG